MNVWMSGHLGSNSLSEVLSTHYPPLESDGISLYSTSKVLAVSIACVQQEIQIRSPYFLVIFASYI